MKKVKGRLGHSRVVVATVIREELVAAKSVMGTHTQPAQGYWGAQTGNRHDFLVTRLDRSNTPAALSARDVLEAWRPEFIILCGIAGGVVTRKLVDGAWVVDGPDLGDVIVGHYVHYADYAKNVGNDRKMRYFALDHPPSRLVEDLRDVLQATDDWARGISVSHPAERTAAPKILDGEFLATESVAGSPRSEAQRRMLRFFDNARAVDMESVGVARSVHQYRKSVSYNPRWLSIRGVSDHVWAAPEDDLDDDWDESENQAQRDEYREYAAAAAAAATKAAVSILLGW